MEVATSNADQPKPVGPDLQSPALAGREAWSLHLDCVQTLCGDFPQPGFPEIMGRMSQRGDTSSSLDERDCEAAVEPGFIHAGGTSIAEETKENLARTADLSSACQIIGQVAPTQAGAGEDATDVAEIDRQPETAQPCDHGLNPLGSASAERCHAVEKSRVVIANEMSEHVKFTSAVLARKLNASDKLDTPPRGLGTRHGECGDRVMVGNCQGSQAYSSRCDDHFAWGASAVGVRCVYMEIGTVTRVSGGRWPKCRGGFRQG
jgi:hypothetical protein